jgi:hypothetical protein
MVGLLPEGEACVEEKGFEEDLEFLEGGKVVIRARWDEGDGAGELENGGIVGLGVENDAHLKLLGFAVDSRPDTRGNRRAGPGRRRLRILGRNTSRCA